SPPARKARPDGAGGRSRHRRFILGRIVTSRRPRKRIHRSGLPREGSGRAGAAPPSPLPFESTRSRTKLNLARCLRGGHGRGLGATDRAASDALRHGTPPPNALVLAVPVLAPPKSPTKSTTAPHGAARHQTKSKKVTGDKKIGAGFYTNAMRGAVP